MKKTILSIAVIAAAIFAASCQKENLQENTASEGSASVFTATIESGASTKTTVERIDGTPATYKTKWENTDKISINGVTYTATPDGTDATKATFTKDSGEDPTGTYKAYFPATMYSDSKATLPASYTYADGKYNMPMYAQSSTTSLPFKNLCGVLAITVNGTDFTSVSSIEVSSNKQMNGEFTATAEGALIFASITLTDADKKVTLTFDSAKTIAADGSATFYIPVPAATHNPLTIKVSDGTTTKTMVTKKSGGVIVERSNIYSINFADNSLPAGALAGVFSISATKKVHFSQGNLWYGPATEGASATFNFEANQYSFNNSWDATYVSHFYWSQSVNSAIAESYDWNCSDSDVFFTNDPTDAEKAKSDFTVSGVTGKYRTLSTTEWQYLFNTTARMVNGKPCYSNAVSGIDIGGTTYKGVFLYPDNYNGEVVSSSMSWDAIKTAGIVFLPAAGYGNGGFGESGGYWSSSAYDEDNAYVASFDINGVSPGFSGGRYTRLSVRLITECQ